MLSPSPGTPPLLSPIKRPPRSLPPSLRHRQSSIFSSFMIMNESFFEFLDENQKKIVTSAPFQRLRRLRQLSIIDDIFPTATHTRYEHSIGVGFLAKKMVYNMYEIQNQLESPVPVCDRISERDITLFQTAGFCHDLGHGMFSHLYESLMHRVGVSFCHEHQSTLLLEKIVNEHHLEYTPDEVHFMKTLINTPDSPEYQGWRYQVIANHQNGIDVDRMDYIQRDSYYLGKSTTLRPDNLVGSTRILNGQVCFLQSQYPVLEEMLTTRVRFYNTVYNSQRVTSVRLMYLDVLADLYDYDPKFRASAQDLDLFLQYDDSSINFIRFSDEPKLERARSILNRVQHRDFYPYVCSFKRTDANAEMLEQLTPENVTASGGSNLGPDDVLIDSREIVVGNEDTWDNISFVNYYTSTEAHKMNPSILYPAESKTSSVRIFARDPEKVEPLRRSIETFASHYNLEQSVVQYDV